MSTKEIAVFWWNYNDALRLPLAYRILYWDGTNYIPVKNPTGLGIVNNKLNATGFDEVKTTRLKIELDSADRASATMLEWIVYKSENSPPHPPIVEAGPDRDLMIGGKTYLSGSVRSVTPVKKLLWTKTAGPGGVTFNDAGSKEGTATFSAVGDYVLTLTATEANLNSSSTVKVNVHNPPKTKRLDVVYTKRYKIDSKLWSERAKAMIVNGFHFVSTKTNAPISQSVKAELIIFIEAAKAIKGQPHARHKGYVFSNAWVHQTVEAMCIALMVDPQGDKEIIACTGENEKNTGQMDSNNNCCAGARWIFTNCFHSSRYCQMA